MNHQDITWRDARGLLEEGNVRFLSGVRSAEAMLGHMKLKGLAENGQRPFAVVLSCSDSRVPAELLFDCGFGELFVVRVAGNVVQPSQIASVEFAATVLGASLCVVMGHTRCGAVQAALDAELGNRPNLGPNIDFLIELIRPSVTRCVAAPRKGVALLDQCIEQNVRDTAATILEKSATLRSLIAEGKFKVCEAVFQLETGKVEFL